MRRTITLIAGLAAVALVAWFLAVKVPEARRAAHSMYIGDSLKNVCLGLINYESTYKRLPPPTVYDDNGVALYSWRRSVMPFIEAPGIGIDPEIPWTADEYMELRELRTPIYCLLARRPPGEPSTNSSVYAVIGPGTAFPPGRPLSLKDVPDNTILIIENTKLGKHWLEPGDFDISQIPASATTLGDVANGEVPGVIHVGFADSSVWALSAVTPLERIRPYFLVESADDRPREEGLGSLG